MLRRHPNNYGLVGFSRNTHLDIRCHTLRFPPIPLWGEGVALARCETRARHPERSARDDVFCFHIVREPHPGGDMSNLLFYIKYINHLKHPEHFATRFLH